MIYILEGASNSGKTTFANNLVKEGYRYEKKNLKTLDEIKHELENNDNVVYDRLFGLPYRNKTSEEIQQLDYYLSSLSNVRCIRFITTLEKTLQKCGNDTFRKKCYEEYYNGFTRLFAILKSFRYEFNIENGSIVDLNPDNDHSGGTCN